MKPKQVFSVIIISLVLSTSCCVLLCCSTCSSSCASSWHPPEREAAQWNLGFKNGFWRTWWSARKRLVRPFRPALRVLVLERRLTIRRYQKLVNSHSADVNVFVYAAVGPWAARAYVMNRTRNKWQNTILTCPHLILLLVHRVLMKIIGLHDTATT